jgi:3-oxoacyl-[acyl-carrier protein] reductase
MSLKKLMDLSGRVAIVTGGSRGLGLQIAEALGEMGAKLAITARKAAELDEAQAHLSALGHEVLTIPSDLGKPETPAQIVEAVMKKHGQIDILVNDAAFNKAIPFTDLDGLTTEIWDKIIAVNLTGPMHLTKAVAPIMQAQGQGRIVNISSVAGLGPQGSSIAYAVSKAGLIHLTKCMALALAPQVLVNCVAPGLLEGTRATANLRQEQITNSAVLSLLKKPADKEDCAEMVVTMCRTETMTGQTVVIDSGRVFH